MCLSPCMAQRLFFHNTLTAHWLILAALCICVYRDGLGKKRYAAWVGLMTFSASIHLYFVPMLAVIMLFDMLYDMIQNRSILCPLASLAASLVCSVALVAVLGGFSTEVSDADQAWSYGILYKYSSNLLTLMNPLGYSRFLPELPQMEEEYEGYGYLGLGALVLLSFSFILLLAKKKREGRIWNNKAKVWCFLGCIAVSFLLASGPRVTIGSRVLVSIPLPWFLDYVFAIFRSIGRFIWIAYYMLLAGAVCVTDRYGKELLKNDKWLSVVFLSLAMLQTADLSQDVILSSQSLYFGKRLLSIPARCCINWHSGLLPRNGGLWPGFQAVRKGEAETGVSIHTMQSRIDDGIVLSQIRVPIRYGDTVWDIYRECFKRSPEAVLEALDKIRKSDYSPVENGYEREYYSFPTREHWREFRERGGRYV